jgi:hypothetical protein
VASTFEKSSSIRAAKPRRPAFSAMAAELNLRSDSDTYSFDAELHADRMREECGVFGIFGHPAILPSSVRLFPRQVSGARVAT